MTMQRTLVGLVMAGCAAAAGCSAATTSDSSYAPSGAAENAGAGAPSEGSGGLGAPDTGGAATGTPTGPVQGAPQQAGQLTAGVWDDNLNYEFFGSYLAASKGVLSASIFTQAERDAAHARFVQRAAKTELDVAIVLDTTSSMADETQYLQGELDTIATSVKTKYPNTTPRFGLVVYRDSTDEYLTRNVPFTADVAAFRASLAKQSAAGGGDIPEAVPEGLAAGVDLDWRSADEVAKIMFWVADAPQHAGTEQAVNAAVTGAAQKGIHVYPVASSGVDQNAELAMRGAAQMTGGRYLFLTDDSGIGNSHAEPHIPCYVVTPLQGAMVRMIESEMQGARVEPAANEVIRTVGAPVNGTCTLQNKSDVILY
jgi:Mg-chelatase subunit ChlD